VRGPPFALNGSERHLSSTTREAALNTRHARFILTYILFLQIFVSCGGKRDIDPNTTLGDDFPSGQFAPQSNFNDYFQPNITPSDQQGQTGNISTLSVPSSSEQACLTGTGGGLFSTGSGNLGDYNSGYFLYGSHDTSGTTQTSNACYSSGDYTQNYLYQMGVWSYGQIGQCLGMVLSQQPASDAQAASAFQMGEMALLRCYRGILQQHSTALPWNVEQRQVFQHQDQVLYWMLLQAFNQQF